MHVDLDIDVINVYKHIVKLPFDSVLSVRSGYVLII